MSLKLGQNTTVVISSSTAAIEVLKKQDLAFANRYVPDAVTAYNHDNTPSHFSMSAQSGAPQKDRYFQYLLQQFP
ncbi:putative cytochrome P450 superfamily [Helianthus annuus]|nr:putative cytochrome P450 superfamily [Helianthus annuus]